MSPCLPPYNTLVMSEMSFCFLIDPDASLDDPSPSQRRDFVEFVLGYVDCQSARRPRLGASSVTVGAVLYRIGTPFWNE